MRRICVFCGSSPRAGTVYFEAAGALGRLLAELGHTLVYGGGGIGLMGALADAALAHGGQVIGVIPEALATREVAHRGLTELRVTPSMHARKAMMVDISDAFVALPGGLGTFDELFEILTWAQLGIHDKPIGILNTAGFFEALVGLVDHAVAEGFVRPEHREMVVVDDEPRALLERLEGRRPPRLPKWTRLDQA
jgi:uncharacterized protein (TIGR00730 family)